MNANLPSDLDGWLELLERRHPKEIDLGLERCGRVWRAMGKPRPAPRVITVAGTNGKGSTVATICALLSALGHRQGNYTTPHLLRYNERVTIEGCEISDRALLDAFERVESCRGDTSLSYFEFGTLAAFHALSQAKLNFAVMEVGLGGRLDAVNLLDADCAVITPIGLDHQEYLGNDRYVIGREKAGIIRPGQPVISGEPAPPASIVEAASEKQARLLLPGRDFGIERAGDSVAFEMDDKRLVLPRPVLGGAHQLDNLATSLAAVLTMAPDADSDCLARGIRAVRLPGRLQQVSREPRVWIDVGHNPMAARAVCRALVREQGVQEYRIVLAMLADKDAASVAEEFAALDPRWFLAGLEGARGQTAGALAGQIDPAGNSDRVSTYRTVAEAFEKALEGAGDATAVLVFGSFLTAADALHHRNLIESAQHRGETG